jgi:hypothetical protein
VLWLCRVVRDAINLEITFYHQPARTEAARRAGDDCVERRYAVDSLPGGILTVLLSPPGRMALATRVLLTSDLLVRWGFVLPDAPQGADRDAGILY